MRGLARVVVAVVGMLGAAIGGEPAGEGDVLVARLVHPDRQAQEVLKLFEGARWRDPAAALADWKQRTPGNGLGKEVEALIALFNPEMAREWSCLDQAELRVGVEPATRALGWSVLIPRDHGTVAAAVTAMHLTDPDDRPIAIGGVAVPVARLGRSGVPLACQVGSTIVVASSRERLERAAAAATALGDRKGMGESGTLFSIDPSRLATLARSPIDRRRLTEIVRSIGCRGIEGVASLHDGSLRIDLSTRCEGNAFAAGQAVDLAWLEAMPAVGVMAAFVASIDPDPDAWDRVVSAADRIERIDPARARLAPLRTRLNLLAMGAGVKLEADLVPHLRGISAALFGDADRPGRPTGALAVLHLDEPEIARRLAEQAGPRVVNVTRGQPGTPTVLLRPRGRDLWIAWGDGARWASGESRPQPGESLSAFLGQRGDAGGPLPSRVGAVWPARLWRPAAVNEATAEALAGDPPVTWRGWSEPRREHDLLEWNALGERVRRVLASVAPASGPEPGGPAGTRD